MFRPTRRSSNVFTRRSDIVVWPIVIGPIVALAMLSGCRRADKAAVVGAADASSMAMAPVISQLSPDPMIIRQGQSNELTIRGAGLDSTGNTVVVGPITVAQVNARNGGTMILLSLPDRVPSGGGAAPMLWSAGRYPVTVRNRRGVSAAVILIIQEPN